MMKDSEWIAPRCGRRYRFDEDQRSIELVAQSNPDIRFDIVLGNSRMSITHVCIK